MSCIFKENKRVLFLVDHKHRDLPSLSLIGYFLQQMEYTIKYIALGQEDVAINSFNPKYIVLPKPIYEVRRLVRLKAEGRKLIVINTEGNPQDIKFKMKIIVHPDLYFFWNEDQLKLDSIAFGSRNSIFKLVGCARTDFLHSTFFNIFPDREVLLDMYSLSRENRTITIATSTQDADFDDDVVEKRAVHRNRILNETANYRNIVNNMRKSRLFLTEMIHHIIDVYPNLNIVVKPHPNENITYWSKLVDTLSDANIYLCIGEPINHLLKVSDLHIALNVCTTTIENMLVGIPTVEIHTDLSAKLYKKDHLQLSNYTIKTVDQLDPIIEKVLINDDKDKTQDIQQKERLQYYVKKYLFKFDGLRCYEHAQEIADFIENTCQESTSYISFFTKNPNLIWPYIKPQVKRPLSYIKQLMKERFFKPSMTKSDEADKAISDEKVDFRGRFDNRIEPGDEEYWFDKFEQAGFKVEDFEKRFLWNSKEMIGSKNEI